MLRLKSIKEEKLWRKFLLAFILMSVVPFLILLYIIHYVVTVKTKVGIVQVQWLVFWLICSLAIGFLLVRKMLGSFLSIAKTVRNVAEGDLKARIENAEELEINELAQSFGRITHQLEDNIAELQKSKRLIQEVLSKVGQAVASFQNIDKFLELIVMSTIEALMAESGQLMLTEDGKGGLVTRFFFGNTQISPKRVKIGEGIIGQVAQQGRAFLTSSSEKDALGHIMCVPLTYGNRVTGAFALRRPGNESPFSDDDKVLLTDLTSQIAIALENFRLSADAERTYVETITALAMAVEARDPYTRGHTERVALFTRLTATRLEFEQDRLEKLEWAALIHDVGKVAVPAELLHKPESLTDEEYRRMVRHMRVVEDVLAGVDFLAPMVRIAAAHHSLLEGASLVSADGRILAAADAFDAMTSTRSYRAAITQRTAFDQLRQRRQVYGAEVVEALIGAIEASGEQYGSPEDESSAAVERLVRERAIRA